MRFTGQGNAGNLRAGRESRNTRHPAVEVTAGNGKFETTNVRVLKPTSPGDSTQDIAVDNRVLPFPAVPGLLNSRRVYLTFCLIRDMSRHPSKPSDDFIVERAVRLLRHG